MNDASITAQFDEAEPIEEAPPTELDIEIDVTFQKKHFTTLHLEEPTLAHIEKAERNLFGDPRALSAHQIRLYYIDLITAVAHVPREVILALKELPYEQAKIFFDNIRARNQKIISPSLPISPDGGDGDQATRGT